MKYYILADVHGNMEALGAVLNDIAATGAKLSFDPSGLLQNPARESARSRRRRLNPLARYQKLVVLGDLAGYGPESVEVIRALTAVSDVLVGGNHDFMMRSLLDGAENAVGAHIHEDAARSLQASVARCDARQRRDLTKALGRICGKLEHRENGVLFVHAPPVPGGSSDPSDEMYWANYVSSSTDARELFFDAPGYGDVHCCFVGHSHVPQYYGRVGQAVQGGMLSYRGSKGKVLQPMACQALVYPESFRTQMFPRARAAKMVKAIRAKAEVEFFTHVDLSPFDQALVVVPSVGQPRDAFAYTGYAIYDDKTRVLTTRRIRYDVETTQQKMADRGLAGRLIRRLALGLDPEVDRVAKNERTDIIDSVNRDLDGYFGNSRGALPPVDQ